MGSVPRTYDPESDTTHSFVNNQPADMLAGRSAMGNIIPASTGAAQAVVTVLRKLAGKFHGMPSNDASTHSLILIDSSTDISVRVPVTNISLVDLTVTLSTPVNSKDELMAPFRTASARPPAIVKFRDGMASPSPPGLAGVLAVSDEMLVSSEYLSSLQSSIIDVDASVMLNDMSVKIAVWYVKEMGFSSRSEYRFQAVEMMS